MTPNQDHAKPSVAHVPARRSPVLLIDGFINLMLGVALVTFPTKLVDFLGVPMTDVTFYPSILGAVLLGIAIALFFEFLRKSPELVGLGLVGAVAINLCGAVCLAGWLLTGSLDIPLRGHVILWVLVACLFIISGVELVIQLKRNAH
jgi:hypothetical protein